MKRASLFRDLFFALLFALAITITFVSAALAGAREIKGFALTVSNMDDSVAFFEQALDLVKDPDGHAVLLVQD
jgi:hypothetical protein